MYSIKELAEKTGEKKRNIRYFTMLHLLPKPERAGRGSVYSEEHVQLLRRIRQLQGAGHSLSEIEVLLQSSSTGMRRREAEPALDALEPLRLNLSLPASSVPGYAVPKMSKPARSTAGTGDADDRGLQLWRRVVITPGIELHVRGRGARTAARLERVLRQALGEETRELEQERME